MSSVPSAQEAAVEPYENVELRMTLNRGIGVFASGDFPRGWCVVRGYPLGKAPARDHRSLQMDWDRHVYFSEPACLINHSCEPNTGVRNNPVGGYDFIALRAIVEGEEITFDYATTEYVSVAVKDCLCGTARCRGRSGGFELLDAKHPALQAGLIAGYLKNAVSGHVRPALCHTPNRKSR